MNRRYNFVSYQPMKVIVDGNFSTLTNSFIMHFEFALLMYNLFYIV